MPFIANTPQQQKQMLKEIGLSMDGLFADIPKEFLSKEFNLPAGMSEFEVRNRLAELAGKNYIGLTSFLGGGFYRGAPLPRSSTGTNS